MSPPQVLHVIPSLAIGGTERQLVEFVRRSSEPSGHRVAVFRSLGPLAEGLPTEPIRLGHLGTRALDLARVPALMRRLRRLIIRGGFDLVHAHLGLSEVLAAVATPHGVPLVASRRSRNLGFEANAALKLVEGLGHRRVDVLICNSRYLAEVTAREDRWPPPTRVIVNAIDLEPYTPVPPFPSDALPHIAVVANLHPYKRQDRFLYAFRRVLADVPGARATLVGDGIERAALEALTAQLGLSDSVEFAGQVADPRPFVARSHAVALTSDAEGFPNALLEAMAQGRPVVATRVGGIPELVRDEVDGLLASGDPDEIAAHLHSLLVDVGLRERLGRSARERASTFTWGRLVREVESVYTDVLAHRA